MTVFTVDVGDGVEPGEQQPLLRRAAAHVDPAQKNKQPLIQRQTHVLGGEETKCPPVSP